LLFGAELGGGKRRICFALPKNAQGPSDFIKASAPSKPERSWWFADDQGLEEEGAGRVAPL
jgi:hypothetical protein